MSRRIEDDGDRRLRDDPAFRLATSGLTATPPLSEGRGLTATLARGGNPEVLREGLVWLAGCRWRAQNGGRPQWAMLVGRPALT